jgi:hypothetical protein
MNPKSSAAHNTPSDTAEAVDALMKSLRHPAEKLIEALRAVIVQAHPSIREGVKWNAPSFRTSERFRPSCGNGLPMSRACAGEHGLG